MATLRIRVLAVLAAVVIVATACGNSGSTAAPGGNTSVTGASTGHTGSPVAPTSQTDMPTPAAAASTARNLWNAREGALAARDAGVLDAIEVGGAKQADAAYLTFVECNCEPPKDAHRVIAVVPVVPQQSSDPSFIAQVRTANEHGDKVWYVIGVRRVAGTWKIGFLSVGWYKATPPLHSIVTEGGYTLPVDQSVEQRVREVASSTVPYAKSHNSLTSTTSYGAVVRTTPQVRLADDGVYGLRLKDGDVLACYTFHTVDRYQIPGGYLRQSDGRDQFGPFLAPGTYRSITIDNGNAECEVGSGHTGAIGHAYLSYDPRVLATTGVPAT